MKPVRASIQVPISREDVYDFLDVLADHEPFTDHMLHDYQCSGAERGVGAKARVKATAAGRTETVDIEVISAQRPSTSVERNIGAGGRRVATGTYNLHELPDGGTDIMFEYAWQKAPISERLASPLVRTVMRRSIERSLQRLAEQLTAYQSVGCGGGGGGSSTGR